jgi:hypothetical protein
MKPRVLVITSSYPKYIGDINGNFVYELSKRLTNEFDIFIPSATQYDNNITSLTDYNEIREAADANAKKKLAEEFPEKFNNLLKEELQNKNKSKKESYKKLDDEKESEKDESELNKESVMKNQEKETKKVVKETAGAGKPFGEKAKVVAKDVASVNEVKVDEDVKITDTVGKSDPFKEKAKGKGKDVIDEEREKDFVGDIEAKTPNIGKSGDAQKGKAFNEKIKGPTSGKPMPNLTEEFDITELDTNSVDNKDMYFVLCEYEIFLCAVYG